MLFVILGALKEKCKSVILWKATNNAIRQDIARASEFFNLLQCYQIFRFLAV